MVIDKHEDVLVDGSCVESGNTMRDTSTEIDDSVELYPEQIKRNMFYGIIWNGIHVTDTWLVVL